MSYYGKATALGLSGALIIEALVLPQVCPASRLTFTGGVFITGGASKAVFTCVAANHQGGAPQEHLELTQASTQANTAHVLPVGLMSSDAQTLGDGVTFDAAFTLGSNPEA